MEGTAQTPIEDLRKSALEHYDEAASSIHCYHSDIPKAINFYYDNIHKPRNQANNITWFYMGLLAVILIAILIHMIASIS